MSKFVKRWPILMVAGLLVLGCSKSNSPSGSPKDRQDATDQEKYLLATEPEDPRPVLDVRKKSKDGEEVVIVGRVGGSKEPLGKDRAYFTIVDPSLKDCKENGEEDCATPWAYT